MTPRARGFTLLEVALAAVLGSIVVLAAISMFASLDSAQKMGQENFDQANAAALTHEAIEHCIQNLMMSNTVPPPRNSQGERVRPGQENAPPDAPPDPRDLELPRLILEYDNALPSVMTDPSSQRGDLMRPQRLEVTVRSRPVFVFGVEREESIEDLALLGIVPGDPDVGTAVPDPDAGADGASSDRLGASSDRQSAEDRRAAREERRNRDRSRRSGRADDRAGDGTSGASGVSGVSGAPGSSGDDRPRSPSAEREAEREGAGVPPDVTTEFVPGVRGVFEFEFDPGIGGGGLEPQAGWVLWWRQLYPIVDAPRDVEPMDGQRVGAVRLMGNISSAAWKMLYTKRAGAGQLVEPERLNEHAAVWFDDLPSYVELDILSNTGDRLQWTFEVGWGVSGEPGTIQATTGSAAGIAGAGPTRNPASAATPALEGSASSRSSGSSRSGSSGSGASGSGKSSAGGKSERRK